MLVPQDLIKVSNELLTFIEYKKSRGFQIIKHQLKDNKSFKIPFFN